jgi:cyanophycinase
MRIKGKIVIIGGAEDKGTDNQKEKGNSESFTENGILSRIIQESRLKHNSRIAVLTAASEVPEELGKDYIAAFRKLDARNVRIIDIRSRHDAAEEKNLKMLEQADILFVTGGDQLRLTSLVGGTPFYDMMLNKLSDPKFIYAGTSAGAAAVSESMIERGRAEDAIKKGEVVTTGGFGFIDAMMIDTHFIQRGRIGRLFQIVVTNPGILGIGLEENSALLLTSNCKLEAIGPGMTIIIDGHHIKNSNLIEIRDGIPLSIDNIVLHVMSREDVYDIKNRTLDIITPDECRQ